MSALSSALDRPHKQFLDAALENTHALHAALAELPAPDDASPRIVDSLGHDDRAPYEYGLPERFARLRELSNQVRKRHAEVAQRRLAFETQRSRLRN